MEVLECFLPLGGKHVLCSRSKEGIIELPPGSMEIQLNIELLHIDLSLGPLNDALQFVEAVCIVLCGLAGIHIKRGLPIREFNIPQERVRLDN